MAKQTLKIHLGLTETAQAELLSGGTRAVEKLASRYKLKDVNTDKLKMFGVLTAKTESTHPEELEAADEIDFVEVDSEQRAF